MTKLRGMEACVFDAYGTLFDVNSASRTAQDTLGEKWQALAELWRAKQLQYTWLRGLGGRHADFWQVTGDALDFARVHLPDYEPWHAWSNFEFIDDDGRVNEVDLLVLTPVGLVLVEIKSRPGSVRGDAQTWTWMTDGRPFYRDNPLPLANRKAKRLAAVLRRQEALIGRGAPRGAAPWVEPLIFLSDVKQPPAIDPGTAKRVTLRGNPGAPDDTGLIGMLLRADDLDLNRRGPFDPAAVRALKSAIEQAGIRPPGRGRRVGDYELTKLLTEGDNWQDFAAKHAAAGVDRRVRIYPYARAASPEARERLARTAQREFRVLEGVEHQGIQRVLDYREADIGHDVMVLKLIDPE